MFDVEVEAPRWKRLEVGRRAAAPVWIENPYQKANWKDAPQSARFYKTFKRFRAAFVRHSAQFAFGFLYGICSVARFFVICNGFQQLSMLFSRLVCF